MVAAGVKRMEIDLVEGAPGQRRADQRSRAPARPPAAHLLALLLLRGRRPTSCLLLALLLRRDGLFVVPRWRVRPCVTVTAPESARAAPPGRSGAQRRAGKRRGSPSRIVPPCEGLRGAPAPSRTRTVSLLYPAADIGEIPRHGIPAERNRPAFAGRCSPPLRISLSPAQTLPRFETSKAPEEHDVCPFDPGPGHRRERRHENLGLLVLEVPGLPAYCSGSNSGTSRTRFSIERGSVGRRSNPSRRRRRRRAGRRWPWRGCAVRTRQSADGSE